MLIFLHHTYCNMLDLDDATGATAAVGDEDATSPGVLWLRNRHSYPVRGSYTVEDGARYCAYWNEDDVFVLRTPDNARIALFAYLGDDVYADLAPQLTVTLDDMVLADEMAGGAARLGYSSFRLTGGDAAVRLQVDYCSMRYLQMYGSDFSYAPDSDLSDWDFFVAVKEACEQMRARVRIAESSVGSAYTALSSPRL